MRTSGRIPSIASCWISFDCKANSPSASPSPCRQKFRRRKRPVFACIRRLIWRRMKTTCERVISSAGAARAIRERMANARSSFSTARSRVIPNLPSPIAWPRAGTASSTGLAIDRSAARLESARSTAEQALKLQPALGDAHLALAYYHYFGYPRLRAGAQPARNCQAGDAEQRRGLGRLGRDLSPPGSLAGMP